jgi:hypothetical protein
MLVRLMDEKESSFGDILVKLALRLPPRRGWYCESWGFPECARGEETSDESTVCSWKSASESRTKKKKVGKPAQEGHTMKFLGRPCTWLKLESVEAA